MSPLADIAGVVHRVLRRELDVDAGAALLGVDPARLDLYRRFVFGHITGVLGKLYPLTAAHLGATAWDRLGAAYFRDHPARDWELNACGRAFPELLDREVAAGATDVHPFHVALAQLEWEQFAVYMHPATVPDHDALDAPIVNPTLAVLALPYAVVPFAVAHPDPTSHSPTTPPPDQAPDGALTLVFRRPGAWRVDFHEATGDLLFAIKVVHERVPLAAAAAAAGQHLALARAALATARAVGVIVGPPPT